MSDCNRIYSIKNPQSGYVWDSSDNNIKIQPFTGTSNQLWKVQAIGFGRFKIVNQGSGKALDIQGGVGEHNLITYEFRGAENQQWNINSDGTIVCPYGLPKGYAADIQGGNFVPGNPVIAYAFNGNSNQQFILVSQ